MNKVRVSAIVSCMLVVVRGVAGDLTVEGNLNVTSNLTAMSFSGTNSTVSALVVNGHAGIRGPLINDVSNTYTNRVGGWLTILGISVQEGTGSQALGYATHAEGNSIATGSHSHAEGCSMAYGDNSHAEGEGGYTEGYASHVEGYANYVYGFGAHAEGCANTVYGDCAHAEGYVTVADGWASHAEGEGTLASGYGSHAAGVYASASNDNTFVWSDGTPFGSTAPYQFSAHARNGFRLAGGPIQGDGSGLTNLTAASMAPGSIGSEALASGAVVAASIALGSVGTNKAVVAEWNSWGDGRYLSVSGGSDLILGCPGRIVTGAGANLTNISELACGASQQGYNLGVQTIGQYSAGASQFGWNEGTQTIGTDVGGAFQNGYNHGDQRIEDSAYGASQQGENGGTQTIGSYAIGAAQHGLNNGTQTVGAYAFGAEQRGLLAFGSSATNSGKGSIQLLDLTAPQSALITGHASLGLGACRVTNDQAIVAGDGLASHGNGTVTAFGFYGDGSQLSGITAAQVGAYTINQADAAVASALSGFTPASCVRTNHTGDVAVAGAVSASAFTGGGTGLTNLNLAAYAGANLTWDVVNNKLHAVAGGASYTDADAVEAVTAGDLNMNANCVTGLADAIADTDAVNRRTATNLVQAAIQNALQHLGPFGNLSMGQFTAQ